MSNHQRLQDDEPIESRPTWYVSAPHRVRVGSGLDSRDEPYGVRHARQVGAAFTECGEPALAWAMFWDVPFHIELELVCQACANATAQHRHGRRSDAVGRVA